MGLLALLMIFSLCISETPQETVPPTTPSITPSTELPTTVPPTTLAPDNPPSISGYNTDVIEKQVKVMTEMTVKITENLKEEIASKSKLTEEDVDDLSKKLKHDIAIYYR